MKEDDIQQMAYDVMHWVGVKRPHAAHSRDILIKFTDHQSKSRMMRHVRNLRRGTKFFVSDQYPSEINDRSCELQRIFKREKGRG